MLCVFFLYNSAYIRLLGVMCCDYVIMAINFSLFGQPLSALNEPTSEQSCNCRVLSAYGFVCCERIVKR